MKFDLYFPEHELAEGNNNDDKMICKNIGKWAKDVETNIIIIVSGDSDFYEKLAKLQEQNIKVGISSIDRMIKKEKLLETKLDYYINLEKHKKRLKYSFDSLKSKEYWSDGYVKLEETAVETAVELEYCVKIKTSKQNSVKILENYQEIEKKLIDEGKFQKSSVKFVESEKEMVVY